MKKPLAGFIRLAAMISVAICAGIDALSVQLGLLIKLTQPPLAVDQIGSEMKRKSSQAMLDLNCPSLSQTGLRQIRFASEICLSKANHWSASVGTAVPKYYRSGAARS